MDGFQRFLSQDASRAKPAPAALGPTLPEVPARQHPRVAVPVAFTAPGQEPHEIANRGAGCYRLASTSSLLRPFARTAPVHLAGLYAKVRYAGLCAELKIAGHVRVDNVARLMQHTVYFGGAAHKQAPGGCCLEHGLLGTLTFVQASVSGSYVQPSSACMTGSVISNPCHPGHACSCWTMLEAAAHSGPAQGSCSPAQHS